MRESVPATGRGAMTKKRRAEVFLQAQGRCQGAGCGVKLVGRWTADHIIPLELAGPDTLANLQALCPACDKAKYKLDAADIGKMRRRRKKDVGQPRPPSRLKGRGFDKTKSRRFDGKVVDRDRL